MMKRMFHIRIAALGGIWLFFLSLIFLGGCQDGKAKLVLGAGPGGSSLQEFAVELGKLLNQEIPEVRIQVKNSPGSEYSLAQVDRGKMNLALVGAEDAYVGRYGQLPDNQPAAKNIVALARLFDTATHLVVPRDSPFKTPYDLRKNRVAIGNPGSESALTAERFFRSLGIWEEIIPIYTGYAMGLGELSRGGVAAVWLLVGFPNESLQETNRTFPVRLIGLFDQAAGWAFLQTYPFYSVIQIPAGTYKGQQQDIWTVGTSAIWVANWDVDENFTYRALTVLFSEKGLAQMKKVVPAAWDLDVKKGLRGVKIPFHPGALRFFREVL